MEIKQQVNFGEFEEKTIKEIKQNKILWLGDPNLSFKKRLYQFIATLVTTLLINFGTKLKWQFGLILYLVITVPIGTYGFIKWIYHLFV